jgi:hypothetical protein
MECVIANNGNRSNLHKQLLAYNRLANFDVPTQDNIAVKAWLNATNGKLISQYPNMPLDINNEPMLFFHKQNKNLIKPGVEELFDSNPELANQVYEALGFNNVITPNDKVVFGHPGIGKTFAKKSNDFIDVDEDYKEEHTMQKILRANAKNTGKKEDLKEWEDYVNTWWNKVKTDAKKSGKQIFVSNLPILRMFPQDFDKVITMSKNTFTSRAKQRNDYEQGETEDWKNSLDVEIAKIDKSKVVSTDRYLSDLFITPQQKQQALQQYSQYLNQIFPNSVVKDIVYHGTDATNITEFRVSDGVHGEGIYFQTKHGPYHTGTFGKNTYSAIVNSSNPFTFYKSYTGYDKELSEKWIEMRTAYEASGNLRNLAEDFNTYIKGLGHDSLKVQVGDKAREEEEFYYIMFNPKQIHILGSKQDIEGFQQFVNNSQTDSNNAEYNVTTDLDVVAQNPEAWQPSFLKEMPSFESTQETIPNDLQDLDSNNIDVKVGNLIYTDQGQLLGNVPDHVIIPAIPTNSNIRYQRTLTNEISSYGDLKTFASTMSMVTGIKFQIISESEAKRINPHYNGEPGFFKSKTAYLINGVANKSTALHEIFGHPIIELLEKDNPELLNRLISEITPELEKEIMELYPEYVQDGRLSYDGQKEALIKAIEREATGKLLEPNQNRLRTLIDMIWNWFKRQLGMYTKLSNLGRYTTIKDITNLAFNGTVLKPDFEGPVEVMYFRRGSGDASETLSDMHTSFDQYKMSIANGVETYVDTLNPKTSYERLTELINKTFSNDVYGASTRDRAVNSANRQFNNILSIFKDPNDKSKQSGLIKIDDKFYTYEQLIDKIEVNINTNLRNGKYVHTLMEYYTNTDPDKFIDIQNRLDGFTVPVYENGKLIADAVDRYKYRFIFEIGLDDVDLETMDPVQQREENRDAVLDILNVRIGTATEDDTILNEFVLANDDLGIATTLDSLIIRSDGVMRLIDYKTGKLDSDDRFMDILMPYMDVYNKKTPFVKKRSIYSMALVMRALMIKAKMPNAKFEEIVLYNIDQYSSPDGIAKDDSDIPVQDYLIGIKNWLAAEKPEVHDKFEKQGLFNFENYMSEGYAFRQAMVVDEKLTIDKLRDQLISITGQIQLLHNAKWNSSDILKAEEKRAELLKAYTETQMLTKTTRGVFEDIDPLQNNLFTIFQNRYDFSNVPVMQILIDKESEAVTNAMKKYNTMKLEHDILLDDVISDFEKKDPEIRKKMKMNIGNTRFGYKMYVGDGSGLFDFAYITKAVDSLQTLGWITETHKDWNKLSLAQQKYMRFINAEMRNAYKIGAKDINVKDVRGAVITKAKAVNMPDLADGFMPYVPPTQDEYNNRIDGIWGIFSSIKKDLSLIKITDSLNGVKGKPHPGMPIRYLTASEEVVEHKTHSLHVEHMFLTFSKQMYLNSELEEVLAVGKGLEAYMQSIGKDENNEYTHKVLINALNTYTKMHITNRSKSGNTDLLVGKFIKDGKEVKSINLTYGINKLKNFTTYSSMMVNPVLAGANMAMIASLNFKTAAVNSLMVGLQNQLGIDVDDIDFTIEDLTWAQKEWAVIQGLLMSGNKEALHSNKMWRMIKEWNILPDDYWFEGATNKEYSVQGSRLTASSTMFLHLLGENYGVITTFGAVVHKLKVKKGAQTKSVFDAYDVKERVTNNNVKVKELTWNFGTRGVVATPGSTSVTNPDVKKITELTSHEIDNIKRVISKIHGDYRKNEKTLAENYALAQWFLQFKKYLIRQLRNMFEQKRIDGALGSYKEVMDTNGKPVRLKFINEKGEEEEETYIEWYGRVTEGRYVTSLYSLIRWVGLTDIAFLKRAYQFMGLKVPNLEEYKGSKLSTDQKKNIAHVGFDLLFLLLGLVLKEGLFDDDEQNDKNPWFVRYTRYMEDMTEGMNVIDTARSMKNPFPMTSRFFNITTYGSQFLLSVATGDRTLNGDYRGQNPLLNNLPLTNSYRQLKRFSND